MQDGVLRAVSYEVSLELGNVEVTVRQVRDYWGRGGLGVNI